MALTPGTRLGVYEVTAAIGEGGMGQVVRARDTKLNRDVALKVVSDSFATDPERLARFTREAQTLASLNHPNIAHLHGLEESGGVRALVMELVEGDDLSTRIARGPIPIDEALPIAKQIAEALEAAHEQGIIHRDLKPANIKVRPDGTVKVLDFGLAKALDPGTGIREPGSGSALANSPTITSPAMTQRGVILGTSAYMSPEQAKGKLLDRRADIWAFGAVLYEMITGRRAFAGDDVSDTLALVLTKEPDWSTLPADVPPPIRRLLRRCLQKSVKARLSSMADARLELDDAVSGTDSIPVRANPRSAAWSWAITAIALVIAAIAGWPAWRTPTPPVAETGKFDVVPFAQFPITLQSVGNNVAMSADGRVIVYTGTVDGRNMLVARVINDQKLTPIAGTEGAAFPFLSPDGSHLGFLINVSTVVRVALAGGAASKICDVPPNTFLGASWGNNDLITFGGSVGDETGVFQVPANGGTPVRITTPAQKTDSHATPQVIAGEELVIFTTLELGADADTRRVDLADVKSGTITTLVDSASFVGVGPGDRLLYTNSAGELVVTHLDRKRRAVTGPRVPVDQGMPLKVSGSSNVALSETGSMVRVSGATSSADRQVIWRDRKGASMPALNVVLDFARAPSISRDGRWLVLTVGPSRNGQLWVFDLTGGSQPRRLTTRGHNLAAEWSPDSRRLTFLHAAGRQGGDLSLMPAEGTEADAQSIGQGGGTSWHPNGQEFLADVPTSPSTSDLWLVSADRPSERKPWLQSPFDEIEPAFSPDGKWVAYTSNATGSYEVWIRPFGGGSALRVSANGGSAPAWSRDGKELFFAIGQSILAAGMVDDQTGRRVTPPTVIVERNGLRSTRSESKTFAIGRDGRLLTFEPVRALSGAYLTIAMNWTTELDRALGAAQR